MTMGVFFAVLHKQCFPNVYSLLLRVMNRVIVIWKSADASRNKFIYLGGTHKHIDSEDLNVS